MWWKVLGSVGGISMKVPAMCQRWKGTSLHDEGTEALHAGRKSRHPAAATAGRAEEHHESSLRYLNGGAPSPFPAEPAHHRRTFASGGVEENARFSVEVATRGIRFSTQRFLGVEVGVGLVYAQVNAGMSAALSCELR